MEIDGVKMTRAAYDRMPRYRFEEQPLGMVFKKALAPLLAMLLASAGLILAAIRRSKAQGILTA